jgi:hypothetical protein
MRRTAIAILGCLFALACRRETSSNTKNVNVHTTTIAGDARNANINTAVRIGTPPVVDKSAIGRTLAADGSVSGEDAAFHEGEPVHVTVWFRESPPGLKASATWYSKEDKIIRREERPMNGQKVVTFTYDKPKLSPGNYRVETFWGGNLAAEKHFEVLAPAPATKHK